MASEGSTSQCLILSWEGCDQRWPTERETWLVVTVVDYHSTLPGSTGLVGVIGDCAAIEACDTVAKLGVSFLSGRNCEGPSDGW